MKKSLLVIFVVLSILILSVTGCGGKAESSKEDVNNEESEIISDMPEKEPQKCESHGVEIEIPGEYNLTTDSTGDNLVYTNSDGSKAIGFSYAPDLKIDSTASIPWENVVSNFSKDMSIDTYEEITVTDLPGIKFFFSRNDGLSGEMAMIIDPNGSCGYIIQMIQSGDFSDEIEFEEILNSFRLIQETPASEEAVNVDEQEVKTTDMELLTFDGHPKYLDDYDEAKLKWGADNRVILCNGNNVHNDISNAIIHAESRGTNYIGYDKYKNNKLESVSLLLSHCNDEAAELSLEDALPIIKEYLPLGLMNDKYHIEDSVCWPRGEDGSEVYFIRYRINEDVSEDEKEEAGMTGAICVTVLTNPDKQLEEVRIDQMGIANYLGEDYKEWNYSFQDSAD